MKFDRKFGIELEFSDKSDRHFLYSVIRKTLPRDEVLITNWQKNVNNKEWICKTDSSCGYEVASPVFRKKTDLYRIEKTVDALKKQNAHVTRKCGIHVHIECRDINAYQLARVIKYWIKSEPIILCMFPKYRRTNQYCQPLIMKFDIDKRYKPTELIKLCSRSKNNSLNVRGYKKRGTLEFRMMEGLLRSNDIINWIVFCLQFYKSSYMAENPKDCAPFSVPEFWDFMNMESLLGETHEIYNSPLWFLDRIKRNCPLRDFREQSLEIRHIYFDCK